MKLNYYLRGLGTGILAATLFFGVAGNGSEQVMTDSEILARAEQINKENAVLSGPGREDETLQPEETSTAPAEEEDLGMQGQTGQEETADSAQDVETKDPEPEETGTQKAADDALAGQQAGIEQPQNGQQPDTGERTQTASPSEKESEKQHPAATGESKEETQDNSTDGADQTEIIVITINSGDSSETVSKKVEQAGLVASAEEYNRFLCANGYDKKLNVGRHEIPVGADETEIAKRLIGK